MRAVVSASMAMLLIVIGGPITQRGEAMSMPPDSVLLEEMTQWQDSVRIEGRRYAVPEQWRGLRVGLGDQAPPADLVSVPKEWAAAGRKPLLRRMALEAFLVMAAAAAKDSIFLRVQSGYRSPEEQRQLFVSRLAQGRQFEEIAWGVAPPGYSEHMLGMTLDLALGGDYETNPAYHWLKAHAREYGFVESYPPDPSGRFPWEPWHWRYVGSQEAP